MLAGGRSGRREGFLEMHFPEARGITRFSYVCFPKTLTVLTCVTQEKGFHLLLTHVSEARTPGDAAKVCQSPALCGSPTRDLWVTVRDHLFYFRMGELWEIKPQEGLERALPWEPRVR